MVLGNSQLVPRRMQLLHQLAPMAKTIGLLVNPKTSGPSDISFGQEAARSLNLRLQILTATGESEITTSIEGLAQERGSALLVGSDTLFYAHRELTTSLAMRHTLAAIYDRREYVQVGGLMSYKASLLALQRQLGVYVGRILKGEKPADLPVMLPTKFELSINLSAAKTLGVLIPASLLAIADEVIE
jgi:putative ABC transport system substrate-binding protein